jgi:hypothetical protein
LERKIEQVVLQAIFAKPVRTILRLRVYTALSLLADPSPAQALAKIRIGEANNGGLIQAVEDLTVQAVRVDGLRRGQKRSIIRRAIAYIVTMVTPSAEAIPDWRNA